MVTPKESFSDQTYIATSQGSYFGLKMTPLELPQLATLFLTVISRVHNRETLGDMYRGS